LSEDDITWLSATELAARIRDGELSPRDVMDRCLNRIEEVQKTLNAFCSVYVEEAAVSARAAESAVRDGAPLGPLHGVPIAIKDFTPIAGKVTTRGSAALQNWVPSENPVIIERLRAAGAIIVAKTTTPEFAYSGFTESPLWGTTRNPYDPTRTSGGSSGGSAVAVATGCVALAEGTDMGGSIRIPAALCGVVGMKPSLGRIPMDILPTVFDSISHFGPLARTVEDAALFLGVTQGPCEKDILSIKDRADLAIGEWPSMEGRRIAMSIDLGFFAVDPEVETNTRLAATALEAAGAKVTEVDLDWTRDVVDCWFAYWSVYLAAMFGNLRAGHSSKMDPALLSLMKAGDQMSAVEFKRLEFVRTEQWRSLAKLFDEYDALICPTMAVPAPPIGRSDADFGADDEQGRFLGFDMACPFNNVAQCPVLSVPTGLTSDGLPTGLQIVGHRFADRSVLDIGHALEASIGFTARPA